MSGNQGNPVILPTAGRIVMVNMGDKGWNRDQWRPAIVVHAWTPETINAVVFLDGLNDREFGGSAQRHTGWITSAVHGTQASQWLWPGELTALGAQVL